MGIYGKATLKSLIQIVVRTETFLYHVVLAATAGLHYIYTFEFIDDLVFRLSFGFVENSKVIIVWY